MLIGAFPDLRFTTELMVADNDLVSAFTKVSGTHQGEFMGIPATGRSFLVNNCSSSWTSGCWPPPAGTSPRSTSRWYLLPACLNRPGFVPVSSRTRGSDTDRVQAAAGEVQLPGAAQLGQQYLRAAGPTPRPAASRAAAANRSPVCRSQGIWRAGWPTNS
jgi:SnoaL-like polyketide cyclase